MQIIATSFRQNFWQQNQMCGKAFQKLYVIYLM